MTTLKRSENTSTIRTSRDVVMDEHVKFLVDDFFADCVENWEMWHVSGVARPLSC